MCEADHFFECKQSPPCVRRSGLDLLLVRSFLLVNARVDLYAAFISTAMNPSDASKKIIGVVYKLRVVFRLLLVALYLSLMLPWYVDILAVPAIIFVTSRIRAPELVLVLISLGLSVVVFETLLRSWLDIRIYYRPHEIWARGNGTYAPNVDDRMEMPFGDLVAIAGGQKSKAFGLIAEPRTVRFVTDSYGYRNDHEYENEEIILVGDSFIAGNGTDQLDTLAYQLRYGKNVSAYALGFPGKGRNYASRAQKFLVDHPGATGKFVFFFFEGNDFKKLSPTQAVLNLGSQIRYALTSESEQSLYDRARLSLLKSFKYPKVVYGITRQRNPDNRVEIFNVVGKPVGFLSSYIENSVPVKKKALEFPASKEVLEHTSCFLFIPTKYRVYRQFIDSGPDIAEPSVYSRLAEDLANASKIKFHDLTDDLRSQAGKLIADGKYVFWRDDTHWNGLGIKVATEWLADNCS